MSSANGGSQGFSTGRCLQALAMTEPDSGSDAFSLRATAEKQPDGTYVLNGHKAYLTFGPVADLCIAFASTRPEAGGWGISAFLVPMDLPGVVQGPLREKMGMRTTPFGDIEFHDVVLASDALLSREGAGASIFSAVLDIERAYVFAPQIGAMERQFARRHGIRPRTGAGWSAHCPLPGGLPPARCNEGASRTLPIAALPGGNGRCHRSGHVARRVIRPRSQPLDAGIASSVDAALLHGAKGYVSEFEIERQLRDAVGGGWSTQAPLTCFATSSLGTSASSDPSGTPHGEQRVTFSGDLPDPQQQDQ